MKKRNLALIVIYKVILTFILIITLDVTLSQTSWTKIEYYYNVGSLPPPYHYNYTITISNEGSAELEYTAGYTKTDNNTYKYNIAIDNDKFRILKNEIKQSNILNLDIGQMPNDKIPDGGDSRSLKISFQDELLTSVPSYPESKYEKILTKLYKAIENIIPDNIWKEIESQKAANRQD